MLTSQISRTKTGERELDQADIEDFLGDELRRRGTTPARVIHELMENHPRLLIPRSGRFRATDEGGHVKHACEGLKDDLTLYGIPRARLNSFEAVRPLQALMAEVCAHPAIHARDLVRQWRMPILDDR